MRKPEAAVIPIPLPVDFDRCMQYLLGSADQFDARPDLICSQLRVSFLADLSKALLADPTTRNYPDVAAFAFWCRKANIDAAANRYRSSQLRVGLGPVFHIAPSNVPINFAYSLAFAFLAGNSSIVRLSSQQSEQIDLLIRIIDELLDTEHFQALRKAILLIRYEHDDRLTEFWLQNTLGRVIWGGDATIAHMRKLESHPRSREIAFPDRYSICAISADAILGASNAELSALSERLFNDVYFMDQHACSSPQLIAWIGERYSIEGARQVFWPAFESLAKSRYIPEPIHAIDKYVETCRQIIDFPNIDGIAIDPPVVTRIHLNGIGTDPCRQRGYFGTLHEISFPLLGDLAESIDPRFQTLSNFGFSSDELKAFVIENRLLGIDRIVPIGRAHEIGFLWDGYDFISSMSRVVDIQN